MTIHIVQGGPVVVLPLIPLAVIAAGAVSGAGGIALGGKGAADIKRARDQMRRATAAYESDRADTEQEVQNTNELLAALGAQQQAALEDVVLRMGEFLRRNAKKVKESERLLVDGIEVTVGAVGTATKLDPDAAAWVTGVIGSTMAGAGTTAGVTGAVGTYGVASTGVAISGLSGAAAESATLAFLGGGSLASGGGGMALGATVLNFVTIGPALLVGGFVVRGQGDRALTQAAQYQAKIEVERAELSATRTRLAAVEERTGELGELLTSLRDRAVTALDSLESELFRPDEHVDRFQTAMNYVIAVRDVAATPVVDGAGVLNEKTGGFVITYRPLMLGGSTDG